MIKLLNFEGCITAQVTPFDENGIDWEGLERLVEFQSRSEVSGILFVGTTGESPTLSVEEHIAVIQKGSEFIKKRILAIGGTGSNNTQETLEYTKAVQNSVDAVLLVDPYYNKPASPQIREFYYASVAEKFPALSIIPYVIPGRTGGTGLLPEDLEELSYAHRNILGVKDATGNDERTIATRRLLSEPFKILSGDDSRTLSIMLNQEILANGVISVISNVLPYSIQKFTELLKTKRIDGAKELEYILKPLFNIVTVKTDKYAWPNPCGVKTLMAGMGMIDITMRPPLGPMEPAAVKIVRKAILETIKRFSESSSGIQSVIQKDFELIEEFFLEGKIGVEERASDKNLWKELSFNY